MEKEIKLSDRKLLKKIYLENLERILKYNIDIKYHNDKGISKIIKDCTDKNLDIDEIYHKYRSIKLTTYDDYSDYIKEIYYEGKRDILNPGYPIWFSKSGGTTGKPKTFAVFEIFKGDYWSVFYPNKKAIKLINSTGKCNISEESKSIFLIWKKPKSYSPHGQVPVGFASSTIDSDKNDIEPVEVKYVSDHIDHLRMSILFSLMDQELECIRTIFINTIVDFFYEMENSIELLIECLSEKKFLTNSKLNEPLNDSKYKVINNKFLKLLNDNPVRCEHIVQIFKSCKTHLDFKGIATKLWPKLQLIIGIYSSITLETSLELCKFYTSDRPLYGNFGYACSESLLGVPLYFHSTAYELFDRFFPEFISYDLEKDEHINKIPIPVWELEVNKTYEIVLTTYTGYCRYRLGDIIKVIGAYNSIPVIEFVKRTGWSLVVGGYRIDDEYVVKAIKSTNLSIKASVAFNNNNIYPPGFGYFVEFTPDYYKKGTQTPTQIKSDKFNIEKAEKKLNDYLASKNEFYGEAVKQKKISKAIINVVPEGTFKNYIYEKARINESSSLIQIKIPICITDKPSMDFFSKHSSQISQE